MVPEGETSESGRLVGRVGRRRRTGYTIEAIRAMSRTEFYVSRIIIVAVGLGVALSLSTALRSLDLNPSVALFIDMFIWGMAGGSLVMPLTYRGQLREDQARRDFLQKLERSER
jgi:hypothetical protein